MNINDYNPVQTTPFTLKEKILSRVWKIINATIFKLLPYNFNGFRVSILKLFGAKIDGNVSIDRNARIDFPWNLEINNLSSIGKNSWIYCLDKIKIGEKTCIGEDVYLITGTHDVKDPNFPLITAPIVIGCGVWIATGVKVLPGVTINNFSVLGAFSILTKNVPENQIWAGAPAKYIKQRFNG
ncbi:colanic acid biosynthesis acetyltransferase WcaF [Sphingobacterium sp. G1-14]|uniref:colanic acid biosynthesis acetyltransferase WcaF n=1 Tax=Sphingobacterium sp. G1-14 TaxID=2003121 RepID=UPI000B495167|nr:colanic acid biosynthesis acetyltransferase WcaF [Sphingobacterium sp. G1-14]